jgi:hypothetical protein
VAAPKLPLETAVPTSSRPENGGFRDWATLNAEYFLSLGKNGPETRFKINDQKRCEDIGFWDEPPHPNLPERIVAYGETGQKRRSRT